MLLTSVGYTFLFFCFRDSSVMRFTPNLFESSSEASLIGAGVIGLVRFVEDLKMVGWSSGMEVLSMVIAIICLGSPRWRVKWEGTSVGCCFIVGSWLRVWWGGTSVGCCFIVDNWLGWGGCFWCEWADDNESGFFMGPEGVPSGESHLRLRRESDGKFLIFRLYSVGLGGRDFIWCRVEGRVRVFWRTKGYCDLDESVDLCCFEWESVVKEVLVCRLRGG